MRANLRGSGEGRGSILVVEDDQDIRQILALILEEEGYRVVEAANGEEALRRLKDGRRYGLIVLDLVMPVMNGWEFREKQLEDRRLAGIPVIVMTACGTAAPEIESIDAVASLPKPARLSTLIDTVRRHFVEPAAGAARQ